MVYESITDFEQPPCHFSIGQKVKSQKQSLRWRHESGCEQAKAFSVRIASLGIETHTCKVLQAIIFPSKWTTSTSRIANKDHPLSRICSERKEWISWRVRPAPLIDFIPSYAEVTVVGPSHTNLHRDIFLFAPWHFIIFHCFCGIIYQGVLRTFAGSQPLLRSPVGHTLTSLPRRPGTRQLRSI